MKLMLKDNEPMKGYLIIVVYSRYIQVQACNKELTIHFEANCKDPILIFFVYKRVFMRQGKGIHYGIG